MNISIFDFIFGVLFISIGTIGLLYIGIPSDPRTPSEDLQNQCHIIAINSQDAYDRCVSNILYDSPVSKQNFRKELLGF